MSAAPNKKRVVVIGAGLGGMSAAIMLARSGFQVTVLEKNATCRRQVESIADKGIQFRPRPIHFHAAADLPPAV